MTEAELKEIEDRIGRAKDEGARCQELAYDIERVIELDAEALLAEVRRLRRAANCANERAVGICPRCHHVSAWGKVFHWGLSGGFPTVETVTCPACGATSDPDRTPEGESAIGFEEFIFIELPKAATAPAPSGSIADAMQALREATAGAWDKIADPDAFIREVRGREPKWVPTPERLEDGRYWFRTGPKDNWPCMVQVFGVGGGELCVRGKGGTWRIDELRREFPSGEVCGPLAPPEGAEE